eukprot:358612-Chlamydomonas_euryale.AAC.2
MLCPQSSCCRTCAGSMRSMRLMRGCRASAPLTPHPTPTSPYCSARRPAAAGPVPAQCDRRGAEPAAGPADQQQRLPGRVLHGGLPAAGDACCSGACWTSWDDHGAV